MSSIYVFACRMSGCHFLLLLMFSWRLVIIPLSHHLGRLPVEQTTGNARLRHWRERDGGASHSDKCEMCPCLYCNSVFCCHVTILSLLVWMTKMVGCVGRLLRWTNLLQNTMLERLDGAVSTSPSIVVFTWALLVVHGHRGALSLSLPVTPSVRYLDTN